MMGEHLQALAFIERHVRASNRTFTLGNPGRI